MLLLCCFDFRFVQFEEPSVSATQQITTLKLNKNELTLDFSFLPEWVLVLFICLDKLNDS